MNKTMNKKKEIISDKLWHIRTTDEVIKELNTSLKHGLSENDVKQRVEKFGENNLAKENKFNGLKTLWNNFNSILIYVLLFVALISFFTDEIAEFYVVISIVFFTIFLSFIQEYRADKSIKALSNLTAKKVEVLRGGVRKSILATSLVPGDIVFLNRGLIVPADLRIIESHGLSINEAILTGESASKSKISKELLKEDLSLGDRINLAFAGTSIVSGSGIGVVVEIGLNSEIGKISKELQEIEDVKSPLQKKIERMSQRISYIVITVAVLISIVLFFKGYETHAIFLLVGAIAVSGIPESFPLALTLALSRGISKMAKQNAVVKDLNSVETLGTTTVICTDKTGTLTENKMRVSNVFFSSQETFEVEGVGYEPVNKFLVSGKVVDKKELCSKENFFKTSILCNDSLLTFEESIWKISGEPTEASLLTLAKSVGFDYEVLRESNQGVFDVPFDPANKFMIRVCSDKKGNNTAYLKGAGERVLDKCSYYRNKFGKVVKLSKREENLFLKEMEEQSSQGYRILFLASKEIGKKSNSFFKDEKQAQKELKDGFVFEGFVSITDPIRSDVFDAIENCRSARVDVVMITGDYKATATSIARKLNIITNKRDKIVEGRELDLLTDSELDNIIDYVAVFSRATPEHKLRIVSSFQRRGEIVAMTGDGVNDSPALKKADIGIAMGKSGTEVAREASNMILIDDNFATIVKAIREGRTIYSNIRRFIYYLLAGNFTEVAVLVIAIILNFTIPLTAIMIFFVNLVTSTIPAMALSVEPTHEKVMRQKPRDSKENLLSDYILSKILVLVPFMVIGVLSLFLWELHILESSLEKAMTIAFVTLIMFELFHVFNGRRLHTTIFDKDFFSNIYIFFAVLLSFILTLIAVYTNFGQSIFSTVALDFNDWMKIFFVSSSIIIFSEVIKLSVKAEFNEQRSLQGHSLKLE